MKTPADLAKTGLEKQKFYRSQKSFGNIEFKNLCQYKFYPAYLTAEVIQIRVEDLECKEAASRSIAENRTELQRRG